MQKVLSRCYVGNVGVKYCIQESILFFFHSFLHSRRGEKGEGRGEEERGRRGGKKRKREKERRGGRGGRMATKL